MTNQQLELAKALMRTVEYPFFKDVNYAYQFLYGKRPKPLITDYYNIETPDGDITNATELYQVAFSKFVVDTVNRIINLFEE